MHNLEVLETIDRQSVNAAAAANAVFEASRAFALTNADTAEVLHFFRARPVHTVVMASFIADNGIESVLNRGVFYGHRDQCGVLDGVALIGHTTLVEARSDAALRSFAITARSSATPIHLIMSSGTAAEDFWKIMSRGIAEPRLACTEALFEVGYPFSVVRSTRQLERAGMEWLMPVAEAQAEVAYAESGVDPMVRDREGFLKRVARRIEQGRTFIVTEGNQLLFKADIIAETDDVAYLEGIYVDAEHRGRGIGSECLAALSLKLMERVQHICMLSNTKMEHAHKSFVRAGYRKTATCTTLFV